MTLQGLTLAFELTAALAAVALAWKRADHRPFAAFLIIAVVVNDLARLALQSWVIVPARDAMRNAGIDPAVTPFTGWVRIACDIEGALYLLWPAGIAALSQWVYMKRSPRVVAGVYVLAVAALVIGYPWLRYDMLRKFYLAAELAALSVGIVAFLRWVRTEVPRISHVLTSCILVIELGVLLIGPWRFGLFTKWSMAQVMFAALYAVLTVLQVGALWITFPSMER